MPPDETEPPHPLLHAMLASSCYMVSECFGKLHSNSYMLVTIMHAVLIQDL